jgi:hypothetical protein
MEIKAQAIRQQPVLRGVPEHPDANLGQTDTDLEES